ncbi:hypothetical protein WS48_18440 [Burkholderia sp. RF7-non_BP1]|nr:hypothetical protein WS45_05895 [Burkholderia sp. RF2-non_BP3]KUY85955.1 hypothetical protein WS46_05730 [Burkholderia sp. RF4-BP95]KUY92825.1 hypothetical protein WS49_26850 [Burkholderia sp. RF7-non_BP4]KUY95333.1 hypothetical protein WS48_18440 [Burkholderia sp. RF7-non_BP1]
MEIGAARFRPRQQRAPLIERGGAARCLAAVDQGGLDMLHRLRAGRAFVREIMMAHCSIVRNRKFTKLKGID